MPFVGPSRVPIQDPVYLNAGKYCHIVIKYCSDRGSGNIEWSTVARLVRKMTRAVADEKHNNVHVSEVDRDRLVNKLDISEFLDFDQIMITILSLNNPDFVV